MSGSFFSADDAVVRRDGDELDPDVALRVVMGVAALAREADRTVYCWVAC